MVPPATPKRLLASGGHGIKPINELRFTPTPTSAIWLPITVTVAGATGYLGKYVVQALITPVYYPSQVSKVVALTRSEPSEDAQEFKALDAEFRLIAGGISVETSKGVDVLVSALPGSTLEEEKNLYTKATADTGVKVYFPTELGYDHNIVHSDHVVFGTKRGHEDYARGLNGGTLKVVNVYTCMFTDAWWSVWGQYIGFDKKATKFTVTGSQDARTSYTHPHDIASSVMRLAVLASADRSSVLNHVHVQGDVPSVCQIAGLLEKYTEKKAEVTELDVKKALEELGPPTFQNFGGYLRWLVGNGHDFTNDNVDEFVSPGQSSGSGRLRQGGHGYFVGLTIMSRHPRRAQQNPPVLIIQNVLYIQ